MRLRWTLATLGVLALAGALAYYLIAVPSMLADDFQKEAEPEHEKVQAALEPVFESFNSATFGTDPISDSTPPRDFIRKADRLYKRDLGELRRAQRTLRKARRALEDADSEAMTDPPSWPLLGGRGDLGEAEDVAEKESDYLRKARAFLDGYQELIDYSVVQTSTSHGVNVAIARGEADTPSNPTSGEQLARPLDRAIRAMSAELRRFAAHRAPAPVRSEQRRIVAETGAFIRRDRQIAKLLRREDIDGANRLVREQRSSAARAERGSKKDLDRLLGRSLYRKQIDDLQRRKIDIVEAYEDL